MTHISMIPVDSAFAFRAVLANDRLIVGALGFPAFVALQRGTKWRWLSVAFSAAALAYAIATAAQYAGSSAVASVLAAAIAVIAGVLVAAWPGSGSRLERITYACAVMAGCLALTNFMVFQNWGYTGANRSPDSRFTAINYDDMFHYFLGTKYSSELSYDRLYVCVAVVAKDLGYVSASQPARDLETNKLVTVGDLLQRGAKCKARFTPKRWLGFKQDVTTFLQAAVGRPGVRYLTDFGYNATPFWTALNRPLVAWTKATPASLGALATLDGLLFLACVAFLVWGFGPAAAALTSFTWGVGVMWVMAHVGLPGSFGRLWWFTALTAAISLARRGRYRSAGVALAASAALRAFPAIFLFWPILAAGGQFLRRRSISSGLKQLLAGTVGGAVAFGLVSMIGVADPIHRYVAFVKNSRRITEGFSSNHVSLQTVFHGSADSVMWWLAAFGLAILAVAACRKLPMAAALVLSGLFGMFILFPMSNYYYLALVLLAPFVLSSPMARGGADLLVYAIFVLLGNAVFIMAPINNIFVYTVDSFLLILVLCYFAWSWYRMSKTPVDGIGSETFVSAE